MPDLSERIRGVVADGSDGWELHYRARELKTAGEPVIMLSIGDHDIKTSPSIIDAMHASALGGHLGYTSSTGVGALRSAIADRVTRRNTVGAEASDIVVCAGGQGAIFASMMAALDPGDACVLLDPFYATFDVTVRAVSGLPIIVPTDAENGFQPNPDWIAAAIAPSTRAILINTPNNPTGAVYERERLEAISELCLRHDLWLISDELYDSQVHDGSHLSPRDLPGMAARTFVIGSMSKGYAMTGARVGWVVAPPKAVGALADLSNATTYGLPGFIQDAATHALTQMGEQEAEIAERYKARRDLAVSAIGNVAGVRISPPQGGMYVMLDIRETGLSGQDFAEKLLEEERIGVMPGESFGDAAAGHVRVALTVSEAELEDAVRRTAALAAKFAAQI
ncbi:MAG: aminotransferase class I/II-fold pyridoxal phosphate-dependent enzyme [Pseudomonadota bacterium]